MVENNNNSNSNNNNTHNNREFNNIDNWNEIELNDLNKPNGQDIDDGDNNVGGTGGNSGVNKSNIYLFNQTAVNGSFESPTFTSPSILNKSVDGINGNGKINLSSSIGSNDVEETFLKDGDGDGANSENDGQDIENTDYTILIPSEGEGGFTFKKLKSFLGPALFISVGYLDPGNWATDLEGGSRFGYQLLWILLFSNVMALFLQTLVIKLALVTKNDLAQMCKSEFSTFVNYVLWIISELAIISTDLAEVIGTAIGLNILFNIPLVAGVAITSLDTLLFLAIQRWGIRKMELIILVLISAIVMCFVVELFLSKPIASEVFSGFIPRLNSDSVFVATSIIGATVMPHNLFLHGSVVKSRRVGKDVKSIKQAYKYNVIDTVLALNCAFFVNISILMLAASVFWKNGLEVTELQQAYKLLQTLMNGKLAAVLFGLGLFLAGQSSTITGTMAGQIVMEGFIKLKVKPWIRRLVTRLLAIIPAVIVILVFGDEATYTLLIVSQVILSIGLPFAVVPLILFTSSSNIMGEFKNNLAITLITSFIALFIIGLNVVTIFQLIIDFLHGSIISKSLTIVFIIPLTIALSILLIWIIILKTNLYQIISNYIKRVNSYIY